MSHTAAQPSQDQPSQNMFGICAAVGEDFGFNPVWLRIALGFGLLFNLEYVIGAYVALGVIVVVSRWLSPNPRVRPAAQVTPLPQPAEPASAQDVDAYPALDRAA